MKPANFSQAELDRFYCSFQKTDGCWNWEKGIANNGYGFFNMTRGKRKTFHAHRVSWSIHNNLEIPEGKMICHHCDNRKCVNPDHLYLGTGFDNNTDTVKRNRAYRLTGDDCSWTKLSDQDVRDIFISGASQTCLAKQYNVHPSHISDIKRGKKRSNVTGLIA